MSEIEEKEMKPYDPKLREAALEFESLCKKYDCMGSCLFVSKTHAEFVHAITPTWSVMWIEPEKHTLRFKSKKEDFPSREAQHEATRSTTHGVTSFLNWSQQQAKQWSAVLETLRKHMTVVYEVWNGPDSIPGDGKGGAQ